MKQLGLLSFFLVLNCASSKALDSLDYRQKKNLTIASSTVGVVYAGSISLLYKTWYQNQSTGKFQLFNDALEWKGMDKIGHFTTSWWISQALLDVQESISLPHESSVIRSAATSLAFMTTIEVFDGFSEGYGFSFADMGANALGITLFTLQELKWGEQRLLAKYSYHNSNESQLRPDLLGATLPEKMLKNYNAQNYWLSFPINKVCSKFEKVPAYLSFSVGYGVSGLYGAKDNSYLNLFDLNPSFDYSRQSHYYFSFDIDLQKIPIRGKAWKLFTSLVRWVKIPAPSLAFNKSTGLKFYPIYW
ncbi:MAG: DUF2279 domain-containing protein [Bacteroidia bacterium]